MTPEQKRESCRKWRAENLEKARQIGRNHQRNRRLEKPAEYMVTRARIRARDKNLPFALTPGDIVIPAVCPALGIPLRIGTGGPTDNSPSLDRLVPERGYVPGNVTVISYLANRIKNNATVDELAAVLRWMETQTP